MSFPASARTMSFIITRDRERAKKFYSEVLGFTQTGEDPFAVVFDLNGVMLRITPIKDHQPSPHTVLGWEVGDIEAEVKALTARGVTFQKYEGFEMSELGIWTAPDGKARVAWFLDPDGNNLSLAQF
ncbi:MAG: VOC family protein [Alphaproteobacteria bacterium]|nr:VOC family protein [Alphaproteobacteria bacterium]